MQADSHLSDERLDQLIRWHGTDETNLPHPDTLKNLSRDTIAALRELIRAREKILELRLAMGRAFCAADFRQVHAILLDGLGPPPAVDEDSRFASNDALLDDGSAGCYEVGDQLENRFLASSAQNTAST